MTLKRLDNGIKGLGNKPKKLRTKPPLDFLEEAEDPLANVEYTGDETPEEDVEKTVKALGEGIKKASGFGDRMKAEADRKKAATQADDYFVIVFEDGAQATAFLKAVGYPEIGAAFVDGTIVADAMGIELPESRLQKKPLKTSFSKKLERMSMPLKPQT